jgi:L-fuculose-phosphate aldolase
MQWSPEQRSLLEEMIQIGRDIVSRKLTLASGGNMSVRDPENSEQFLVTGAGTWFDRLGTEDFSTVSMGGSVLNSGVKPSSEWKLHQRTYLARPDVTAIIHVHPQYSVLIDALGHKIRFFTLDHISYVESIGTVPYAPNGSDELGDSVAEQFATQNCVILGNHGSATAADSLEMAYRRVLNLEEAAMNTYRALLLGDKTSSFQKESSFTPHS